MLTLSDFEDSDFEFAALALELNLRLVTDPGEGELERCALKILDLARLECRPKFNDDSDDAGLIDRPVSTLDWT